MLRDGPTPSPEELDALADVGPADMARAAALFRRAVGRTPRRALKDVLDATRPPEDPATGPIPDESAS